MKRNRLRIMGICLLVCGLFILSLFAYKKISREVYLRNLLKENIVLEIPSLNIKVPVLEGTDSLKRLPLLPDISQGRGNLGREITALPDITARFMRRFLMTSTRFKLVQKWIWWIPMQRKLVTPML